MTIAGSDPSGGAGIQADLKTFHQFGVYGEAVITLLTVQNSLRMERIEVLSGELVADQIRAVLDDMPPAAVKTGALGSAEIVRAVARTLRTFGVPLVVDPVLAATHGLPLAAGSALDAMRTALLPQALLITPNLPEAEALSGIPIHDETALRLAACRIRDLGPRAVLLKGGHREGPATDLLLDGNQWFEFPAPRIDTPHTHGTGCTYSAAITASLALGLELPDAVARAKRFIGEAIRTAPGLGRGNGPVNHHARVPESPPEGSA